MGSWAALSVYLSIYISISYIYPYLFIDIYIYMYIYIYTSFGVEAQFEYLWMEQQDPRQH